MTDALNFSPTDVLFLEQDLRSTEANRLLSAEAELQRLPEDRALALDLKNTIRRNAWRMKAGLPLRPARNAVVSWLHFLALRFSMAAFRRRRRRTPTPNRAA